MSDPRRLGPDGGNGFDRVLLTFCEDSLLWPVLAVFVLTVATLGSAVLMAAVADRKVSAMGVTAALAGLSIYGVDSERRRKGRFGALALLIGVLWVLSLLGAVVLAQFEPGG